MGADPVSIARDLVRCRSVTPAEGGALGLIESLLAGAGFAVHRMTFAQGGSAPVENLYARLGTGSPHLAFAGHTDVVPAPEEPVTEMMGCRRDMLDPQRNRPRRANSGASLPSNSGRVPWCNRSRSRTARVEPMMSGTR